MQNNITHASIVPLIGGMVLASNNAFGKLPEYILSHDAFADNDNHIVEHLAKQGWDKYYSLDGEVPKLPSVDVISTLCPCAGLSSLSPSASGTNPMNDWMVNVADYVLENLKPKVFWGENAPRLATNLGKPVRERLEAIAMKQGYTFLIYQTKSLLHGVPQVRDRTFYFFFKENHRIPVFPFYRAPLQTIEDLIRSVKPRADDVLVNKKTPTIDDPFYRYTLEVLGLKTHKEFQNHITKSESPIGGFEQITGKTFKDFAEWIRPESEKMYENWMKKYEKIESGRNIMRKGTTIPKGHIGAFVGHYPAALTHPDEDRYLTERECLAIMKMPEDFEFNWKGKKNVNHVCQNVPISTATSIAHMIKDYLDGTNKEFIEADAMMIDNRAQRIHDVQRNVDGQLF